MKKSEILEEARKYLVPVFVDGFTCFICNAVQFTSEWGNTAEIKEIVERIQSILDASDGAVIGCSINAQTIGMYPEERYELRLMFMDFLILMYQDEERSTQT